MNFASPPAIPISPVSYPSSPESTRISPAYSSIQPVPLTPTYYGDALQNDPFRAEAATDEGDGAIEQALENAKANTTLIAPALENSKQDAVKNTLSKFASIPKRSTGPSHGAGLPQPSVPQKQTMDVDAFTRLLLTGNSGSDRHQDDYIGATSLATALTSDASSGADTASISQRSLLEQGLNADESSRSSVEFDLGDAEDSRRSRLPIQSVEVRKKPPPPAPRHGKLIRNESPSGLSIDPHTEQSSSPIGVSKKPPTSPLARRQSQNSGTFRPTSSRTSSASDVDTAPNLDEASPRPPPPPRSRRPVMTTERRRSSDLPTTMEESDSAESSTFVGRKSSESRPAPPPARNSTKRLSMATVNAPPVPPPRRGRGSSRSSFDGQRPVIPTTPDFSNDTAANGVASLTSEPNQDTFSYSSNATDIMADIAALQREVEEARRKVSR